MCDEYGKRVSRFGVYEFCYCSILFRLLFWESIMTAPEKIYMSVYESKSVNRTLTCDTKRWLPSDIPYVREDLTEWRPIGDGTYPDKMLGSSIYGHDVVVMYYTSGKFYKIQIDDDGIDDLTDIELLWVTHWQPIPEPPRSES